MSSAGKAQNDMAYLVNIWVGNFQEWIARSLYCTNKHPRTKAIWVQSAIVATYIHIFTCILLLIYFNYTSNWSWLTMCCLEHSEFQHLIQTHLGRALNRSIHTWQVDWLCDVWNVVKTRTHTPVQLLQTGKMASQCPALLNMPQNYYYS